MAVSKIPNAKEPKSLNVATIIKLAYLELPAISIKISFILDLLEFYRKITSLSSSVLS